MCIVIHAQLFVGVFRSSLLLFIAKWNMLSWADIARSQKRSKRQSDSKSRRFCLDGAPTIAFGSVKGERLKGRQPIFGPPSCQPHPLEDSDLSWPVFPGLRVGGMQCPIRRPLRGCRGGSSSGPQPGVQKAPKLARGGCVFGGSQTFFGMSLQGSPKNANLCSTGLQWLFWFISASCKRSGTRKTTSGTIVCRNSLPCRPGACFDLTANKQ